MANEKEGGGRNAWQPWYGTQRWKKRRRAQLRAFPICAMCQSNGRITPATVADHRVPHRGDPTLFWFGQLQSLCSSCHNTSKRQIEEHGFERDIGPDGWPLDSRHPANRPR